MTVEAKDVRFFEILEVTNPNGRAVRIEGLVFHSSLAVKRVGQRRNGDAVQVDVELTPTREGLSGSFTVEVPIADGVKRILFGPSAVQIWPQTAP